MFEATLFSIWYLLYAGLHFDYSVSAFRVNEGDADTLELCMKYSQAQDMPAMVTAYVNVSAPNGEHLCVAL